MKFWNCAEEFGVANMVLCTKSVKDGSGSKEWNQNRDSGHFHGGGSGNLYAASL